MPDLRIFLTTDDNQTSILLGQYVQAQDAAAAASAAAAAASAAQAGAAATTVVQSLALQKANNLSDLLSVAIARANLGAAASGANSDITALSGLTTALTIAQGGTGGNTAQAARTALAVPGLNTTNKFSVTSGSNNLEIDAPANSGTSGLLLESGGLSRWRISRNNATETGTGNAGSQNVFTAYDDTGASLGNVWVINRADQIMALTKRPTFNGATPWDSANLANPAQTGAAASFTTISASGLITPTSTIGIKGTATNDNAQAGSIGEFITNTGTGVALTTVTSTNITSVSLTAGDWMVDGIITYSPAGTTTAVQYFSSISSTSATAQADQTVTMTASFPAGATQAQGIPPVRYSLATTTTIYLVGTANFSTSTMSARGKLNAWRVR